MFIVTVHLIVRIYIPNNIRSALHSYKMVTFSGHSSYSNYIANPEQNQYSSYDTSYYHKMIAKHQTYNLPNNKQHQKNCFTHFAPITLLFQVNYLANHIANKQKYHCTRPNNSFNIHYSCLLLNPFCCFNPHSI